MEALQEMLEMIEAAGLPEGDYLKLANLSKTVYQNISQRTPGPAQIIQSERSRYAERSRDGWDYDTYEEWLTRHPLFYDNPRVMYGYYKRVFDEFIVSEEPLERRWEWPLLVAVDRCLANDTPIPEIDSYRFLKHDNLKIFMKPEWWQHIVDKSPDVKKELLKEFARFHNKLQGKLMTYAKWEDKKAGWGLIEFFSNGYATFKGDKYLVYKTTKSPKERSVDVGNYHRVKIIFDNLNDKGNAREPTYAYDLPREIELYSKNIVLGGNWNTQDEIVDLLVAMTLYKYGCLTSRIIYLLHHAYKTPYPPELVVSGIAGTSKDCKRTYSILEGKVRIEFQDVLSRGN